jgi:hypothetical protein
VNEREVKRLLAGTRAPREVESQERAWAVVQAAYDEREPVEWPRRRSRPLLAAAAGLAVLAAAVSPTGRAVLGEVRDAIGRERVVGVPRSKPALFSLPAAGRLLVQSRRGAWIVDVDGSRRLLGRYREASWSPGGRFVVVTRSNELRAVDPKGNLRWSLARREVSGPSWSPSGFRIAYRSGRSLRVVAGDGTSDRLLAESVAPAAAWKPGRSAHVLAYVTAAGTLRAVDTDRGETQWQVTGAAGVTRLEWSADGRFVLAQGPTKLLVVGRRGRQRLELLDASRGAARIVDAHFSGKDAAIAFVQHHRRGSTLSLISRIRPDGSAARRLFEGRGRFAGVTWSPNGRWLLVGWESADQWVFVDSRRPSRVVAVSDVTRQFNPGAGPATPFPRVSGWCCR